MTMTEEETEGEEPMKSARFSRPGAEGGELQDREQFEGQESASTWRSPLPKTLRRRSGSMSGATSSRMTGRSTGEAECDAARAASEAAESAQKAAEAANHAAECAEVATEMPSASYGEAKSSADPEDQQRFGEPLEPLSAPPRQKRVESREDAC